MPLIGWTWYFLEIVFCKRKWEEDRDTVIAGLRCLADYPEYMWVSPCTYVGPGTGGCTGWCHLTRMTVTCITSGKARPIHSRAWGPPAPTAPIESQSREGGGTSLHSRVGSPGRRGCPGSTQAEEPPLQGGSSLEVVPERPLVTCRSGSGVEESQGT